MAISVVCYTELFIYLFIFFVISLTVVGSKILALECYSVNSRINKVY